MSLGTASSVSASSIERSATLGSLLKPVLEGHKFLSHNWDIMGCFDAEADLSSINIYDCDADVSADEDFLLQLSRKD